MEIAMATILIFVLVAYLIINAVLIAQRAGDPERVTQFSRYKKYDRSQKHKKRRR